jgi:DinB superfamily
MPHHLVKQLRFARNEFCRCLEGVSEEDGGRRLEPMNCIAWMVGHLANQEQRYWLILPQGKTLYPDLNELVGYGRPASTPSLAEKWGTWREITSVVDVYLEDITEDMTREHFEWRGSRLVENIGTLLLRNTDHYWFHTGEAHAVRQMLGHGELPQFVGSFEGYGYGG